MKLLARVRQALRLRHYSRRTEQVYVAWVRRFVRFAGTIAFIIAARLAGRHGVVLSREEVARYIENFFEGRGDDRDWNEFTSIRIRDPDLDRIRQSCIGNETNPLVLRALLDEVPGRAA